MTKSACELSFKNGIHLSYSDNHNNFDDYKKKKIIMDVVSLQIYVTIYNIIHMY